MKTFILFFLWLSIAPAVPAVAQEQYTEGPVWDITYVRTKPDQRDAYLTSLKENTAPILEEEKKEGLILDYKILNNLTQKDPHDWDLAIAVQYKNFAALDGVEIKELEIRNKMFGSKKAAEETMVQKRVDMREVVSIGLYQELKMK
jgi:hypothetical protein